jgi:hypothetical protein
LYNVLCETEFEEPPAVTYRDYYLILKKQARDELISRTNKITKGLPVAPQAQDQNDLPEPCEATKEETAKDPTDLTVPKACTTETHLSSIPEPQLTKKLLLPEKTPSNEEKPLPVSYHDMKGTGTVKKELEPISEKATPYNSEQLLRWYTGSKKWELTFGQSSRYLEQQPYWDTGWLGDSITRTVSMNSINTTKEVELTPRRHTPNNPERPPNWDTGWRRSELTLGKLASRSLGWSSYWDTG